ncbi:unnamed protein product [Ambrosiozyma monospora]|uniref:Unnamed protein product n=1 Tax=Ambrosiozyma monospora TaxID=43982 RepID=A0ACB5TUY3_AMBMO|nr:unnamed protein product [Ambrosiozyma monospora]
MLEKIEEDATFAEVTGTDVIADNEIGLGAIDEADVDCLPEAKLTVLRPETYEEDNERDEIPDIGTTGADETTDDGTGADEAPEETPDDGTGAEEAPEETPDDGTDEAGLG